MKVVFFLKISLLFKIFYCFFIFVDKHFINMGEYISKSKLNGVIIRNLRHIILYKDEYTINFVYLHWCTLNKQEDGRGGPNIRGGRLFGI